MNISPKKITRLLINIDHVATLRNARRETFPDPVHAAVLAETAGADGIVFHHRVDERHINERDVRMLKATVKSKLDFELSMDDRIVGLSGQSGIEKSSVVRSHRCGLESSAEAGNALELRG